MSAEELVELVMEVYSARKEAKEYLEYYLNPDIHSKRLKTLESITKELHRVSRRQYAPRVSRIKAEVKHFISYAPDDEMLCGLMTEIFEMMTEAANAHYFKETFQKGCAGFLSDTLTRIDRCGLLDQYFGRIDKAINTLRVNHYDTRQFRSAMRNVVEKTLGVLL